jgi:hypothetical protein
VRFFRGDAVYPPCAQARRRELPRVPSPRVSIDGVPKRQLCLEKVPQTSERTCGIGLDLTIAGVGGVEIEAIDERNRRRTLLYERGKTNRNREREPDRSHYSEFPSIDVRVQRRNDGARRGQPLELAAKGKLFISTPNRVLPTHGPPSKSRSSPFLAMICGSCAVALSLLKEMREDTPRKGPPLTRSRSPRCAGA